MGQGCKFVVYGKPDEHSKIIVEYEQYEEQITIGELSKKIKDALIGEWGGIGVEYAKENDRPTISIKLKSSE